MKRVILVALSLSTAVAALAVGAALLERFRADDSANVEYAAYAKVAAPRLQKSYEAWKVAHEKQGGDRDVRLALGYRKGLSGEFSRAAGTARLDLLDGRLEVEVTDLPAGDFDVWIVDNRPGAGTSVQVDASDLRVHAGRLVHEGAKAVLAADLDSRVFESTEVDLVVVARAGDDPSKGLLYGSLPLFQQMYTAFRTPSLLAVSDFAPAGGGAHRGWFGLGVANAAETVVDPDVVLTSLVATGADLFINETFQGNGRTCATCHPFASNTQLSVSDIASFSDTDPLFVAEFNPNLAFTAAGPKFEVPVLMRGAALITENQDGMDDLANKFNMRGIPHTLGLSQSLTPATTDGTTQPPNQRTGWSGDGAPNGGTLRDFATGAVTQHFPKTLARNPLGLNPDFRLPTNPELLAMEAFQLSLGRQAELDLTKMTFKDPIVDLGKSLFMAPASRCNVCHHNAGANFFVPPPAPPNVDNNKNRNFNTGVEDLLNRPIETILASLNLDLTPAFPGNFPRDGGFGSTPGLDPTTGFGNGSFNTPSLIEAADTGPFFHGNQLRTIEGAVAFYNSQAFNSSPSVGPAAGPPINLQPTQIEDIAAFLRAINALDNIRQVQELATAVRDLAPNQRNSLGRPLLQQASFEMLDAIEVLSGADVQPEVVNQLRDALQFTPPNPRGNDLHPNTMTNFLNALQQVKNNMVAIAP